ncbi:L-asparaginase [Salmonella enterica subsp. enterica]|uniref:L-asparaginase n=1 Tax=Salmonella enterica I TaxID=59201 RepID=A0A3S4FIF0_SALET|nr:L-asparaginase [Salmonella enterica subsp. enterica]
MEFFRKTALAALVMGFSGAAFALPNITILATGGTIAGGGDSATKSNYTAGKVGVENLVGCRSSIEGHCGSERRAGR